MPDYQEKERREKSPDLHVEHEHRLFPRHGMKLKKNKFKGIEKEQGKALQHSKHNVEHFCSTVVTYD